MCRWRDLAIQRLPDLREIVLAAGSHADLWWSFKEILSEAGVSESRRAEAESIYEYAWWCVAGQVNALGRSRSIRPYTLVQIRGNRLRALAHEGELTEEGDGIIRRPIRSLCGMQLRQYMCFREAVVSHQGSVGQKGLSVDIPRLAQCAAFRDGALRCDLPQIAAESLSGGACLPMSMTRGTITRGGLCVKLD